MEDSITETELKTGTVDFNQIDDEVMKPAESSGKRKQEEEEEEQGSKRSGGIINHLISNLVTPSSPRSPRGSLSSVFSATTEADKKEDEVKKSGGDQDVEMGGGIINNFISNIFQSNTEGGHGEVKEYHNNTEGVADVEGRKDQDHVQVEVNGGSGGGIINNLITNLFHQNEGEVSHEDGVHKESEEHGHKAPSCEGNGEHVKIEEEKSNAGIISNLVSNIEENYDPANDEASIMIHSIIHD
ncbi:hypothetical protein MKW94_016631 [Papaver nudicaule]|uniref:Uncharacterized protein n=1 Tax=Papaver nudicaule TaxID=74823 RepID=A0AA42B640_PAPNU|nr:hypothetical protein [Papaver nudicaule]